MKKSNDCSHNWVTKEAQFTVPIFPLSSLLHKKCEYVKVNEMFELSRLTSAITPYFYCSVCINTCIPNAQHDR